ncbi:hypothetical protein FZEAL_10658 [Fusarium zealandicum]|uniref:Thiol-specific monooxygenase n=1 Tax=Fusarium zealandicum TaxID=1053134 RepID=A0A8H4X9Y9_9HYPO|nr:hypothetical protein FZEAL_10658 [Fusarium zealandicum]
MKRSKDKITSVAIIGAGAAGAVIAAALKAEDCFERIRVFERRECPGGTWIYDPDPIAAPPLRPGELPLDLDKPLPLPGSLPTMTAPSQQQRYAQTPVYENLTTNVPDIAMSFSDSRFPYGPFVPHNVPRQYIENYFSLHRTDEFLCLNTTLEDLSKLDSADKEHQRWKLTLRKYDPLQRLDIWWEEEFDALVLANGHYSVPWVPKVAGLESYMANFPGRVMHSKYYRSPRVFANKNILVIGNSTSGHDITNELISSASLPVYQSRRSRSRWDGEGPPPGVEWKPVVKEYRSDGTILLDDDTVLRNIDTIIYCTGYQPSFPFWNTKVNGRPLWDYQSNKLVKSYWHTFFQDFSTLAIVGVPRVLTFRSFEYQAVALARIFSGRNAAPLPSLREQEKWEQDRETECNRERRKFHDIRWETGETIGWVEGLFQIAGLGTLAGEGRIPPALTKEIIWAIEHLKKYPDPREEESTETGGVESDNWVVLERPRKDLLAFI